jgi:cAMP-binding proteins - catabolite gene activator and regulatory subunit of cAMP-dependent protein kinases
MDLEQQLASVPLLSRLERKTLKRLAQTGKRRTYAPGKEIVREGTTGSALYIVLSGRASVRRKDSEASLGLDLFAGDFFGELALLENHQRTATVVAVEETECLLLVAWEFTALLKEHPEIAVPIMEALITRLHKRERHNFA